MGQYFIICNFTKKQKVKPAFANWKWGEWGQWDTVLAVLGWDKTDNIVAYGDDGDRVPYNDDDTSAEDSGDEVGECKQLYICNFTDKIVDKEYLARSTTVCPETTVPSEAKADRLFPALAAQSQGCVLRQARCSCFTEKFEVDTYPAPSLSLAESRL